MMEVDIHISCIIDQYYPETGFNLIKLIEKAGVKVHYPNEQTCCGQTAFLEGYWDDAKQLGEKFIRDFSNNRLVVSASPGCMAYVKTQFDELFYNGAFHNEYKQLQRNTYEVSDFLVNVLKKTDFGATYNHRAAYIASCVSKNSYRLKNEPARLLAKVNGLELVTLEFANDCFGMAGMFAFRFESVAIAMIKQLTDSAIQAGVDRLITNDPVVKLHLSAYINKQQLPLQVDHLVDVLTEGWKR